MSENELYMTMAVSLVWVTALVVLFLDWRARRNERRKG